MSANDGSSASTSVAIVPHRLISMYTDQTFETASLLMTCLSGDETSVSVNLQDVMRSLSTVNGHLSGVTANTRYPYRTRADCFSFAGVLFAQGGELGLSHGGVHVGNASVCVNGPTRVLNYWAECGASATPGASVGFAIVYGDAHDIPINRIVMWALPNTAPMGMSMLRDGRPETFEPLIMALAKFGEHDGDGLLKHGSVVHAVYCVRVGYTSDGSATGAYDAVASPVPSGVVRRMPIRINVNIAAAVVQGHLLDTMRTRIEHPKPREMTLACLPLQYEYLRRHDPGTMDDMRKALNDIANHFIDGSEMVGDEIHRESAAARAALLAAEASGDASDTGSETASASESESDSDQDETPDTAPALSREQLSNHIDGLEQRISAATDDTRRTVLKKQLRILVEERDALDAVEPAQQSASKAKAALIKTPSKQPATQPGTPPTVMGLLYYISVLRGRVYAFC